MPKNHFLEISVSEHDHGYDCLKNKNYNKHYILLVVNLKTTGNWGQYNVKYLSGYSAGEAKYDTIFAAVAECPKRPGEFYFPFAKRFGFPEARDFPINSKFSPYLMILCSTRKCFQIAEV